MDLAILHWIQGNLYNPVLDTIMIYGTHLGSKSAIWLLAALVMVCMKKYRVWGITMIVSIAACYVIGDVIIKDIVARPRPFVEDPTLYYLGSMPSSEFSFPSGHTSASFCAAMVIAFSNLNKGWKIGAWVVAFFIGFSRIYLCVHNPSDVLAGAIFGMVIALIGVLVAKKFLAWWNAGKHQTV